MEDSFSLDHMSMHASSSRDICSGSEEEHARCTRTQPPNTQTSLRGNSQITASLSHCLQLNTPYLGRKCSVEGEVFECLCFG